MSDDNEKALRDVDDAARHLLLELDEHVPDERRRALMDTLREALARVSP